MNTLLASLVAIAALDSLNPTATAIQLYLLSNPKPVARSISFIAGVFTAYWTAGLLVVLGLSKAITALLSRVSSVLPLPYFYGLQMIIGVVLLIVGLRLKPTDETKSVNRPTQLAPFHTFILGLGVTIWEFPTALPYLAAVERIIRANLDIFTTMGVLALYNAIFVLPLVALLGVYIVLQAQSANLLNGINRSITVWGAKILRIILIGLGVILILDFIAYFVGHPLLPTCSNGC